MIFVDRNSVPVPDFFSSKEYNIKVAELKRFYRSTDRSQKRFTEYSIPEGISLVLKVLFNSKCAYCESIYDFEMPFLKTNKDTKLYYYNGINNFRPKNNTKNNLTSKTSLEYYWWLTYEWRNLYYSCPDCAKSKSSWFPVEGKRAKLKSPYNEIIKTEKNLLIDPCNDNPNLHLDYDLKTGKIIPISKKGEVTIQILNLNRKTLIYERRKAIEQESKYLDYANESLKQKNDPITKDYNLKRFTYWESLFNGRLDENYLAIRRKFIFSIINRNQHLKRLFKKNITNFNDWDKIYKEKLVKKSVKVEELVFNDIGNSIEISLLKNIQLEKIELKNYKCFDNFKINLQDNSNQISQEPWLVFLGENGVGKSSVLKAISIALMGQKNIDKLGFDPTRHLQYGKRVGYIRLYDKNGQLYEVRITKKGIVSNIQDPISYLIGYGSTRLLPKGKLEPEKDVEYVKIKNLFDYSVALSDAKSWLLNVSTKMFDQVAISLKDLLLLDNDDTLRRNKQKNELYIKYAKGNNRIDVSDLSDGYKTIFAITVDLIKTLSKDNLAFETAEGMVLIDEIGTHLHPRWKMEVVNRLRRTFPKLQFIATTHEPLCLRGLRENEVIVLKKDHEGEIIAINDLPNPSEFRVDQLLTSEYFGLNSSLDFETESMFNEYYKLLAKEEGELTDEEKSRRDELSEILPKKKHLGNDIRDELVYYVIDELLAKQVQDKGYKIVDNTIKKEARDKVKSIWEHIAKNETIV